MKNNLDRILKVILALILFFQIVGAHTVKSGFFSVDEKLAESNEQTKSLLNKIAPKVINFKRSSGVIFSSDLKSGWQLIATARHVETGSTTVLPKDDVHWTVFDSSKKNSEISYSAYGHSSVESEIAFETKSGELAIALGFPGADHMSYSVGTIMSDSEVRALQKKMKISVGDKLEYDPNIERFVRGVSYQGMSGGPVFNVKGEWVGTLIRGGTLHLPPPNDWKSGVSYFRFLRASYVLSMFNSVLSRTGSTRKKQLEVFAQKIQELQKAESDNSCRKFYLAQKI